MSADKVYIDADDEFDDQPDQDSDVARDYYYIVDGA
jgi:hypothetical protein